MTSDEAAAVAGVEPAELLRAADRGEVAAYRIGSALRFRAPEVEAWRAGVTLEPVEVDEQTKLAARGRLLLGDDPAPPSQGPSPLRCR